MKCGKNLERELLNQPESLKLLYGGSAALVAAPRQVRGQALTEPETDTSTSPQQALAHHSLAPVRSARFHWKVDENHTYYSEMRLPGGIVNKTSEASTSLGPMLSYFVGLSFPVPVTGISLSTRVPQLSSTHRAALVSGREMRWAI